MKVLALFVLWLWPLALGVGCLLLWFFGFPVPIDWTTPRCLFAVGWIALPILFSPGLRG